MQKHSANLDWDSLEAVLLVGRYGTVRAAAEAAGVAHTTLARRVASAERQLGIVAFVRSVKGYVPTDEGRTVMEHAERMAFEASSMRQRLTPPGAPLRGEVRISLNAALLSSVIAPSMGALQETHPRLRLSFDTTDQLADLNKREADIVLRIQNAPLSGLVGRRIGPVHAAVYRHTGNEPIADKPMPVIGWAASRAIQNSFAELGFPDIRIIGSAQDIAAQVALAQASRAAMELPCYVGDTNPSLERLGDRTRAIADLWCLTHPSLRGSRSVRAIFDWLTKTLNAQRRLLAGQRMEQ